MHLKLKPNPDDACLSSSPKPPSSPLEANWFHKHQASLSPEPDALGQNLSNLIGPEDWCLWGMIFLAIILSGHIQDWEHTRCLGACRALTDLQGATQGEHVPAECLSRNEKKAAFSFYLSLSIYNGWVTQRKGLIKKKAVTCYYQWRKIRQIGQGYINGAPWHGNQIQAGPTLVWG